MRVAMLSPTYLPEVRRGTERFMADLGSGLSEHGHTVEVITSHPGRGTVGSVGPLRVIRSRRPPEPGARYLFNQRHISHLPASYLALCRGGYDLAHAFYPTDGLAAARWRLRTYRPAVLSLMGMASRSRARARVGGPAMLGRAAAGASATVALSEAAAGSFECQGLARPRVIHPGIDLRTYRPRGPRSEVPSVICAAALDDPRKQPELLLQGFARARRQRPGLRLVLAPPRPLAEPVRRLAAEDGVEVLDTRGDREALARAYSAAWASVLTSFDEAFGLVLAEGLACGTPAVGPRDGAIPEVVGEGDAGRMFAPGDVDGLASAMIAAVELAADDQAEAVCRHRGELFGRDRMVDAYLSLYEDLSR